MPEFVPGLQLSRHFYEEAVRPLLEKHFPVLPYSAALLGHGSEVLGYDTERSTDHHWGPKLQLFLSETDDLRYASEVKVVLSKELPLDIAGYSTNFGPPDDEGVQLPKKIESGPVNHMVTTHTVKSFFEGLLNFDPHAGIAVADWLTFPQQELLSITRGDVFYDGLGELNALREKFKYYPKDVWLYLVACQWKRISQEEAFVGRTGELGDEIGSKIIAARLVRDLMKLCFLLEKTYWPYSKWLGTAFSKLRCSKDLAPIFADVPNAATWKDREKSLCRAYEYVGHLHNAVAATKPVEVKVSPYFGRPFMVIHAERFVKAALEAIRDPKVKAITTLIGSVDQFSDSTDFLTDPRVFGRVEDFFK